MPIGLNAKLSGMMFLQYAIWGAWLPLLWPYLHGHVGFTPGQIGNIFAIGAIGAIVAPLVAGQIADRWFPTQIFLAVSHLVGAAFVWLLASTTDYETFCYYTLAYSIIYAPTLPLTNSLAFHHMPDRDRDFGRVRVWGTIGWIVVGIGFSQWLAGSDEYDLDAGRANAFRLSAILGWVMGVYCFLLPHTPPKPGHEKSATLAAILAVRKQPLLMLFLLAVPVSCIHQFYFVHTAGFLTNFQGGAADMLTDIFGAGGGGLMTIGQMAEILVLASMPFLARKLSRKSLLAIGLAAYAARMAIFAYIPSASAVMFGIALHGLCFGCFIFVAFMIVDEETSSDVRASTQSLFNLVIVGIGTIVGSKVATWIAELYMEGNEVVNYAGLFSWPTWGALACLGLLAAGYPGGKRART